MSEDEINTVVNGLSIYAKALKRSRSRNEYPMRKLLKKDVPQLVNLIKTVRAEFGFDSSHPSASMMENELNKLYEIHTQNKSTYFVLTHAKKIAGGAGFGPLPGTNTDICELKCMYFSSQLRGLGLGALLLEKVLQEAKKAGFKSCYLETNNFMHRANTLYIKFGFKPLDRPIGNAGHAWTNCWYIKEI